MFLDNSSNLKEIFFKDSSYENSMIKYGWEMVSAGSRTKSFRHPNYPGILVLVSSRFDLGKILWLGSIYAKALHKRMNVPVVYGMYQFTTQTKHEEICVYFKNGNRRKNPVTKTKIVDQEICVYIVQDCGPTFHQANYRNHTTLRGPFRKEVNYADMIRSFMWRKKGYSNITLDLHNGNACRMNDKNYLIDPLVDWGH